MFRRPKDDSPDSEISRLGGIFSPSPLFTWGPSAMTYLGVPIVIGVPMIVVQDENLEEVTRKLVDSGFIPSSPDRNPAPEILARLPDPEAVMRQVHAGYERVDSSTTTFDYPSDMQRYQQLHLIPSSFANLPGVHKTTTEEELNDTSQSDTVISAQYDVYDNISYPTERTLLESLVRAAVDEENHGGITSWAFGIRAWVSLMVGYLALENDILDDCSDEQVKTWYNTHFGRIHEEEYGPFDRRITKRLGSGKEMPVDMAGRPL